MSQFEKTIGMVLSGLRDQNISFAELVGLLDALGFSRRVKGDHHIFTKPGVEEIINLQPTGNKAKPYQVKQVRNIILKYKLGGER